MTQGRYHGKSNKSTRSICLFKTVKMDLSGIAEYVTEGTDNTYKNRRNYSNRGRWQHVQDRRKTIKMLAVI